MKQKIIILLLLLFCLIGLGMLGESWGEEDVREVKNLPDKVKKATRNIRNVVDKIAVSSGTLKKVSTIRDLKDLWDDIKDGYLASKDMLEITKGADAANLGKDINIATGIIRDALVDYVIDNYYENKSGNPYLEPNIVKMWVKMGKEATAGNFAGAALVAGWAVFDESVAYLKDLEGETQSYKNLNDMGIKRIKQFHMNRLKKVDPDNKEEINKKLESLAQSWREEGKDELEIIKLKRIFRRIPKMRKEYIENFKENLSKSQDSRLTKLYYDRFKKNMEELDLWVDGKEKQQFENLFKDRMTKIETKQTVPEKLIAAKKEDSAETSVIEPAVEPDPAEQITEEPAPDNAEQAMLTNTSTYNSGNEFIIGPINSALRENKKTNRPLQDYDPGSMNGSANVRFTWE